MAGRNAWYGCRRDTRDARDVTFKPRAGRVPAVVDLRDRCPAPLDQGDIGSCVAHGVTAAIRHAMRRAGEDDVVFSRLQLYFDAREAEGTAGEDAGAEIRTGIKCAAKIGLAVENLWPYAVDRFKDKPSEEVYRFAKLFRALKYERVPVGINSVKQALARGTPVVIGITLYDSFESDRVAKGGMVPMPNLKTEGMVGGHCMLAVGYGQRAKRLTVLNSWGSDWGDGGFCYLPESYLGSPSYGSDYWSIDTAGSA